MNILLNLISLDHSTAEAVLSLRTGPLDRFFVFITNLGSWYIIAFLFILISIIFYYNKKTGLIWPFLVSVAGTGIMTVIIKFLVNRSRPGIGIALFTEQLPSFPSAHAALILALFGFLIYAIWRYYSGWSPLAKILLSIAFTLVILLIGFSRLFLGVHYLSDVLAGYLVGLLWVLISMHISGKSSKTKLL